MEVHLLTIRRVVVFVHPGQLRSGCIYLVTTNLCSG